MSGCCRLCSIALKEKERAGGTDDNNQDNCGQGGEKKESIKARLSTIARVWCDRG